MKKLILYILAAFSLIVSTNGIALNDPAAEGLILTGATTPDKPQIYFFQNISKQGVWIDHPTHRTSMSAGWSSYLQTTNWSALVVNHKNFVITCAAINPGKVDALNCAKVLSICSPTLKADTRHQRGTYWLGEDLKWEILVKKVEKSGFSLNHQTLCH